MKTQRFTERLETIFKSAMRLAKETEADALLVSLEAPLEWKGLKRRAAGVELIVAGDKAEQIEGADGAGIHSVLVNVPDGSVYEKLTQSLLECVARDYLASGSKVVALYSGFEAGNIDSVSVLELSDHLGQLTSRDLRKIRTKVPLDTLKQVVDLAVEIGREGREGKPVGTIFVVGDSRAVLAKSHPAGFDPVKGYARKDRNLDDARVREGLKEIAPMDGAFIVAADGTVEAACRYLDAPAADLTLSKGLGSRHWAAAAITRNTKAIAVTVSESSGTVRLFQNGEVVLRIEPFRRAMKWKDFEFEPPVAET